MKIDCKHMDRYIPLFLEDKLTGDELELFLRHIDSCSYCYDEMETSYLVKEAIIRLDEEEGSYDLYSELNKKIEAMRKCCYVHEILELARRVILILSGFSVLSLAAYLYVVL
ncbi:MAG: zf-HC2 domain-containing protein [Lachnospiraceae bacterium]|nr:zf-HC2 domain-containing protein [Lachnospiraceae bacterium]